MSIMHTAFWFYCILIVLGCMPEVVYEKHHLPDGYTGSVYIFHDISKGIRDSTRNGYTIYNIDTNGIVCSQSKMQFGRIDHHVRFYYENEKNGRNRELYFVTTPDYPEIKKRKNEVSVWSYGWINYNGIDIVMYRVDTLSNFLDSVKSVNLINDIPLKSCQEMIEYWEE